LTQKSLYTVPRITLFQTLNQAFQRCPDASRCIGARFLGLLQVGLHRRLIACLQRISCLIELVNHGRRQFEIDVL
jgi:hypothetical protein